MSFDVIVLGVGGMGSAVMYQLAKRGMKVLGLERHSIAHDKGSSHGHTRLIRKAYFESEAYVPLLHRAYELWDTLSAESGSHFLHRTGLLVVAPTKGDATAEAVRTTAERHDVPVEMLTREETQRRFPQFTIPDGFGGIYEPGAGYLLVEKCVAAYCKLAMAAGATLTVGESVLDWQADGDGVVVTTNAKTYRAAKLVITAGAWTAPLLASLKLPLTVCRVPQFWFASDENYGAGKPTPCFAFVDGAQFIYGFPNLPGVGLKIASHSEREPIAGPDALDRKVRPSDWAGVKEFARRHLPGVQPNPIASSVCMYTMTPDEHFILDRHPEHKQVSFAAGFSGHGFKFASVVGEVMADLAMHGETSHPIGFLRRRE